MSHPDEIIDQAAKALGKLPHDEPWPGFISKQIIEQQLILARRVADAGLLADPEAKAHAASLVSDGNTLALLLADSDDARNLLSWLHAEAVWRVDGLSTLAVQAARLMEEAYKARDLAVAHDTQPYPTAQAYEKVCRVRDERQAERDERQARIDKALALHQLAVSDDLVSYCNTCLVSFPCPTVDALSGGAG